MDVISAHKFCFFFLFLCLLLSPASEKLTIHGNVCNPVFSWLPGVVVPTVLGLNPNNEMVAPPASREPAIIKGCQSGTLWKQLNFLTFTFKDTTNPSI